MSNRTIKRSDMRMREWGQISGERYFTRRLPRNVTKAVIYLWHFGRGKEERTQRSQSCERDKPYIIVYLAN